MSTPAWSMGHSKRSTDTMPGSAVSPGPGSYDYDKFRKRNAPVCRVGSAPRNVEYKSDSPGPGAYSSSLKNTFDGPKYHIGGAKTEPKDEKNQTPGPGYYDATKLRGTDKKPPAFSIRSRSAQPESSTESPGPGAYNQDSGILNQRTATVKLGTAERDQLVIDKAIPGPGAYISNVAGIGNVKEGPKWRFGATARTDSGNDSKTAPGPGCYVIPSIFEGKNKGVTIVSRRPDSALCNAVKIPGPGAYNFSFSTKARAPTYKLGNAPRSILDKELVNIPGPGNYNPVVTTFKGCFKMGTSARQPINEANDSPGPGYYTYRTDTNYGPKFGIIPRREDVVQLQKDRKTPGPGAYEPILESTKTRNPRVRVGSSKRDDIYRTDTIPGPGSYDTRGRPIGPKWGFGVEARSRSVSSKSSGPGPGSYNIKPKFAELPHYALSSSAVKS